MAEIPTQVLPTTEQDLLPTPVTLSIDHLQALSPYHIIEGSLPPQITCILLSDLASITCGVNREPREFLFSLGEDGTGIQGGKGRWIDMWPASKK